MHYVCNYNSNGPYFSATQGLYHASSLKDILFHVRLCMEDGDYQIGVLDDEGECKGIWLDEAEPEPDGEGDWNYPAPVYRLYRPGEMNDQLWRMHVSKFKRP